MKKGILRLGKRQTKIFDIVTAKITPKDFYLNRINKTEFICNINGINDDLLVQLLRHLDKIATFQVDDWEFVIADFSIIEDIIFKFESALYEAGRDDIWLKAFSNEIKNTEIKEEGDLNWAATAAQI